MFWCRFGFHSWGKWTDKELIWSSPLFGLGPERITGQGRVCTCCGKKEIKS